MTSLESIVLPLEQSRALVEHGIVLDTALFWIQDGSHHQRPVVIEPSVYVAYKSRIICSAPTLSELLDAIRAKHSDVNFEIYDTPHWVRKIQAWMNDDVDEVETEGTTDLLAAAALLMEVSR